LRKSIRAGMLQVRYSVCEFMMTGLPRDRKRGTETTSIPFTGGRSKATPAFSPEAARDSGVKIRAQVLEPAVAGEKCDCGPGLLLGKQSPGRQTRAGVAAGQLDDGLPGAQLSRGPGLPG